MLKELWRTLQDTVSSWLHHEGARLAASLSLYSLLSLAPLVILSIAIASLAFGATAAGTAIVTEVRGLMGPQGAQAVQGVIQSGTAPELRSFASAIGIVVLLFGASSVFGELQSALNKIYEVDAESGAGILSYVKSRLFSFAMVLGIGFLLLISLVFSAVLAAVGGFVSDYLSVPHALLFGFDTLISLGGISCLIALILRYVPDRRLPWRAILEGSIATAILFTAGKSLIGLYLGKASVGSAYGAAGSLVAVIVWVYYSAMIFYFGAEFTSVRAQHGRGGSGQQPRTAGPVVRNASEASGPAR